MNSVNLLII